MRLDRCWSHLLTHRRDIVSGDNVNCHFHDIFAHFRYAKPVAQWHEKGFKCAALKLCYERPLLDCHKGSFPFHSKGPFTAKDSMFRMWLKLLSPVLKVAEPSYFTAATLRYLVGEAKIHCSICNIDHIYTEVDVHI